jgi:hypothetical protein
MYLESTQPKLISRPNRVSHNYFKMIFLELGTCTRMHKYSTSLHMACPEGPSIQDCPPLKWYKQKQIRRLGLLQWNDLSKITLYIVGCSEKESWYILTCNMWLNNYYEKYDGPPQRRQRMSRIGADKEGRSNKYGS